MEYYKAIDVWSRKDDGRIVRYRCFQLLPDGGYCVQSADYYHAPFGDARPAQHEKQFLELLLEEAPKVRSPLLPTLIEAIRAFDRDFREPGTDAEQT
jgi:hypothetical protein